MQENRNVSRIIETAMRMKRELSGGTSIRAVRIPSDRPAVAPNHRGCSASSLAQSDRDEPRPREADRSGLTRLERIEGALDREAMIDLVAEEISIEYGGNAVLNRLEAEMLVHTVLEQDREQTRQSPRIESTGGPPVTEEPPLALSR